MCYDFYMKHKKSPKGLLFYRRFKTNHKVLHIFFAAIAIVFFWRGVWGLMDTYFFPDNPVISNTASVFVAFVILYFDDFHLKELE